MVEETTGPVNDGYAVYNPHNKPIEELPKVFGFSQASGFGRDVVAMLVGQDGDGFGSHMSSSDYFAKLDIGMYPGRGFHHRDEAIMKIYPDGFRMVWKDDLNDPELQAAFNLNRERFKQASEDKAQG